MDSVQRLIDSAAKTVGSESALARTLGVAPQMVCDWKAGRKTCQPADRARLAAISGDDAVQELVRATLENASGRRLEQLQQALGKLSQATGVAHVFVLGVVASLGYSMGLGDAYFIRCIERSTTKRTLTVA